VVPGAIDTFQLQEGSSTDRADLETLAAANGGGGSGWWERMQPVADMSELTRALAQEHYMEHWDGYSIGTPPSQPHNSYLHSDATGRFALIPSGPDQTWLEPTPFGVSGNGALMRHCAADPTCRALYVDALRQIADNPDVAALPANARAIRA